jgi:hypothetical protein
VYLQRGVFWTRWRPVHSVRGWKVQDVDWNCNLHGLWSRDVFCSSRGLNKLDMQRLSVQLQLDCGKRSFDELHLQHRIDGTEWRPVCYGDLCSSVSLMSVEKRIVCVKYCCNTCNAFT